MAKQTFSQRFWYDKKGNFVVWQRPNLLLLGWIVVAVFDILLPDSSFQRVVNVIGAIMLGAWAIGELGWGVDYFRRMLGLLVILLMLFAYVL